LVADGTADPRRIGSSGGSYGGYATLARVAFTPDIYAAAVAIVAPSNLITLLDAIPRTGRQAAGSYTPGMADPHLKRTLLHLLFLLKPGYGRSSLLGGSFGTPGRGNPTAPRPVSAPASVADKPPHELKRFVTLIN
jgi:prolyl oligopeptidase family protein